MAKQTLISVFMVAGLTLGAATATANDEYQAYASETAAESALYYDGPYAIHKSDVQFSEKWRQDNMPVEQKTRIGQKAHQQNAEVSAVL